jgi:integrase
MLTAIAPGASPKAAASRTLTDYRSCLRLYVLPRIGTMSIQAVRPSKITITGSSAVIGGERVNGTIKSGRTRVVSIDDETVAVLRQRKADQAADQLRVGDSWRGSKDGHVFTTGWGEPTYPNTVTSLMTELIRAYNQPGGRPHPRNQLLRARLHDLRHIHATTLLLSGVPVPVVAARLGHADPAITLRVYAHVIRIAEAAAADIFAQAVKAA